jgi:AmmeMemoRadiSam system protein A
MSRLLEEEQKLLLHIARAAVFSHLSGASLEIPNVTAAALTEPRSVFVSLHKRKELRGCIGNLQPTGPLFQTAADCAIGAAVGDPRFAPVRLSELDDVTFEISVLSSMERIHHPNDIEVGAHGVMVARAQVRGLLLPQVAGHFGWNRERFLEETCRKAGLRPQEWREGAAIHRFTAQVFSEETVHAA